MKIPNINKLWGKAELSLSSLIPYVFNPAFLAIILACIFFAQIQRANLLHTGLRAWVESPDFHLAQLGVNCVELQPLHEFDDAGPDEYHWGYMTNNYFAPESSYALAPAEASGVRELQDLVTAFHRRGMAVVVDVVFNHVGVPAHLLRVDRLYYFEQDAAGALTNWSGCGNDLRARSAMVRRLIIDSCVQWIETYGVDGFRFDLAELLGVEVLRDVEAALKRVKPDVILIAEPWSLGGYRPDRLAELGYTIWDDRFRNGVRGSHPLHRPGALLGKAEPGVRREQLPGLVAGLPRSMGGGSRIVREPGLSSGLRS